jgi:mannose-6-phosphate isomerase-like protein (cupin superfamily)
LVAWHVACSSPLAPVEVQEAYHWKFTWPKAADPKVRVEHRVAEGDFAEEIVRMARAVPCDLIVMGTQGRSGLARLVMGSVAEAVLRQAPCPVLTARRPPGRASQTQYGQALAPSSLLDCRPLGNVSIARSGLKKTTLIKIAGLEAARLVLPESEVFEAVSEGDELLHCVEGRIAITIEGQVSMLDGGMLLYLASGQEYSVRAVADASLLVTTVKRGIGDLRPPAQNEPAHFFQDANS